MNLISLYKPIFLPMLLSFFFLACNRNDPPQPEQALPSVQSALHCPEGGTRYFDLEPIDPGTYLAAFRLSVEPVVFTINECLCHVKRFSFRFTTLPESDGDIDVWDKNNQPVEHSVERFGDESGFIVIEEPALIAGNNMDVYLDVQGISSESLTHADGLCVIDNLDGGDPTAPSGPFTDPLKLLLSNNNGGIPTWAAFIPTVITH